MRESIAFRESRVAVQSSIHCLKLERVHQEPGNLATMQMLSQGLGRAGVCISSQLLGHSLLLGPGPRVSSKAVGTPGVSRSCGWVLFKMEQLGPFLYI